MLKRTILFALLISSISANIPALAETSLQDIQKLAVAETPAVSTVDSSKGFDKDHWAYQSLANISKKYGLLVNDPNQKFDGTKPLSRNEAAIILVDLIGKIHQDRVELTDSEKTEIRILKQELGTELQELTGRVDNLEASVDTLKGGVSKLQEDDNKSWKLDCGEKFKINGAFQLRLTENTRKGFDNSAYSPNFGIPFSMIQVSGKLHPHINYLTHLLVSKAFNEGDNLFGEAYVSTDIIPHHNIYLGQVRAPIGYEGQLLPPEQDTALNSQIARHFGNYFDAGLKVAGSWKYLDYTVGAFNGRINNLDKTDLDYGTWVVLKPLANHPELGKLDLGGGYLIGRDTFDHNTLSAYAGYRYKRYAIRGEYGRKDGYLTNNNVADGWYIQNTYLLTKKFELLAKFDTFDPNAKIDKNSIREYTIGGNYYLANNIKLELNLMHVNNLSAKDSERFFFQTQYLF